MIQTYFRRKIKSNKIKQDLRMEVFKIFNVNANILSVMICVLDKNTITFEKWMKKKPQKTRYLYCNAILMEFSFARHYFNLEKYRKIVIARITKIEFLDMNIQTKNILIIMR